VRLGTVEPIALTGVYKNMARGIIALTGKPARVMISIVPGDTLILPYTVHDLENQSR
jgi:hypothetical protein